MAMQTLKEQVNNLTNIDFSDDVAVVLLSMKERFFFLGPTSFGEILCWMLWLGKDFPKL